MIYPDPLANGLPTFLTTRLGLRSIPSHTWAKFMCGRNPNPTENHHSKQGKNVLFAVIENG